MRWCIPFPNFLVSGTSSFVRASQIRIYNFHHSIPGRQNGAVAEPLRIGKLEFPLQSLLLDVLWCSEVVNLPPRQTILHATWIAKCHLIFGCHPEERSPFIGMYCATSQLGNQDIFHIISSAIVRLIQND